MQKGGEERKSVCVCSVVLIKCFIVIWDFCIIRVREVFGKVEGLPACRFISAHNDQSLFESLGCT